MIDTLQNIDLQILRSINGWHTLWADVLMWRMSGTLVWVPLYALFLYKLLKGFKKKSMYILISMVLLVASTDQTTNLIKYERGRLRPSHQPGIAHKLHYVNDYRGGKYSFPSGHAANTMGVAIFLTLLLGHSSALMRWLPIPWSLIVGFSRIYLGVHFPSDVLAGFLLGALWGWLWFKISNYYLFKINQAKKDMQDEEPDASGI